MKLGKLVGESEEAYRHPNVWVRQRTAGLQQRLAIGPTEGHIDLILKLSETMADPFYVLYVLVAPRGEGSPGRYQSGPIARDGLTAFLQSFREFFEGDGRAHLWIASIAASGEPVATLVYDNHDIIYAYGPLRAFEKSLVAYGLRKEHNLDVPLPHSHHYNVEFDAEAKSLLAYWDWSRTDLQDEDEPR